MNLEPRKTERRTRDKDVLSAPRAEIISRVWQAVAFLEEVRADLGRQIQQTAARDQAAAANLASTVNDIASAAGLLAPRAALRNESGSTPE